MSALTITNPAGAIGVTRAARTANIPIVISFTVETNGLLPSGSTLCQAVCQNASRQSHAELDNADQLDQGDPDELARDYASLI